MSGNEPIPMDSEQLAAVLEDGVVTPREALDRYFVRDVLDLRREHHE